MELTVRRAAMAMLLSPTAGSAAIFCARSISSTLRSESTTNAAIRFVTEGPAGSALVLALDVLRSMSLHNLRIVGLSLLALAGVAGLFSGALPTQDRPKVAPRSPVPGEAVKTEPTGLSPGRMRVQGPCGRLTGTSSARRPLSWFMLSSSQFRIVQLHSSPLALCPSMKRAARNWESFSSTCHRVFVTS